MHCDVCGRERNLVDGETYRHFWPCGCSVQPTRVFQRTLIEVGDLIRTPDGFAGVVLEIDLKRHPKQAWAKVETSRGHSEWWLSNLELLDAVWYATGGGHARKHPTREGAIAAWRAFIPPYRSPPGARRCKVTEVECTFGTVRVDHLNGVCFLPREKTLAEKLEEVRARHVPDEQRVAREAFERDFQEMMRRDMERWKKPFDVRGPR